MSIDAEACRDACEAAGAMFPKRKSPENQYGRKKARRRIPFDFAPIDPEVLKGPLGQPCPPSERRGAIGGMSFVPPNHQPEALRPRNQMAATMTVEPTDDQVQQVVEFAAGMLDAATARRYLRVSTCSSVHLRPSSSQAHSTRTYAEMFMLIGCSSLGQKMRPQ